MFGTSGTELAFEEEVRLRDWFSPLVEARALVSDKAEKGGTGMAKAFHR
jgi:hypothetical protein